MRLIFTSCKSRQRSNLFQQPGPGLWWGRAAPAPWWRCQVWTTSRWRQSPAAPSYQYQPDTNSQTFQSPSNLLLWPWNNRNDSKVNVMTICLSLKLPFGKISKVSVSIERILHVNWRCPKPWNMTVSKISNKTRQGLDYLKEKWY